ncbi:hypothetical protein GQ600_4440 [Phytophthora cactorum]|nr:hypothetical protein GQ600_4440 [Phytophthora cactorum]
MVLLEKSAGIKGVVFKRHDEIPSATRNANIAKAARWWKTRETILYLPRGVRELSTMRERVAAVFTGRVLEGRGRRWSEWVSWLYLQLLNEIDLLRKLGLKFDASMRLQLALRLLKTSIGLFNCTSVDKAGALVVEKLSPRWIQTCMEAHQIHLCTKSGKTQEIIKKNPDEFAGKPAVADSVDSDAGASGNSDAEGMGAEKKQCGCSGRL